MNRPDCTSVHRQDNTDCSRLPAGNRSSSETSRRDDSRAGNPGVWWHRCCHHPRSIRNYAERLHSLTATESSKCRKTWSSSANLPNRTGCRRKGRKWNNYATTVCGKDPTEKTDWALPEHSANCCCSQLAYRTSQDYLPTPASHIPSNSEGLQWSSWG